MSLLVDTLAETAKGTIAPLKAALSPTSEAQQAKAEGRPPPPPNPARTVQQVVSGALGLINAPVQLMNTGFAVATHAIAKAFPALPAATMGCLYLGPPHGHLHPPSFTPPVTPAPVPLPSLGPIMLGTSIQVLINGFPAARAGDLGFAVTCVGIFPVFEVFLGSSNVFIGGMRAARMSDLCRCCQPTQAGPVRGIARAMKIAGEVAAAAGVAADLVDAAEATDPNVAAAKALAAGMSAAAMAADAATMALTTAMGTDMAVPPSLGMIMLGQPNVLIGGFPMINFPNPAMALFKKLASRKKRPAGNEEGAGPSNCAAAGK